MGLANVPCKLWCCALAYPGLDELEIDIVSELDWVAIATVHDGLSRDAVQHRSFVVAMVGLYFRLATVEIHFTKYRRRE
jgi:hypothetical protein